MCIGRCLGLEEVRKIPQSTDSKLCGGHNKRAVSSGSLHRVPAPEAKAGPLKTNCGLFIGPPEIAAKTLLVSTTRAVGAVP